MRFSYTLSADCHARGETSELLVERRLDHESGEAHAFYRSLQSLQEPVRLGIEATGPVHWFERLLAELGHELWIGDSAKIRASEVRKEKTDERDARRVGQAIELGGAAFGIWFFKGCGL